MISSVSAWLLSITGVILLSVLAELILPEGQINKYIKVIFSFVILIVIIWPLPSLVGKELDLKSLLNSDKSHLQEDFLYQINLDKVDAITKDISDTIEDRGLLNVSVSVNASVISESFEIFSVYVDLCDIEYSDKFGSKNIQKAKEVITEIINKYANVQVKFSQ